MADRLPGSGTDPLTGQPAKAGLFIPAKSERHAYGKPGAGTSALGLDKLAASKVAPNRSPHLTLLLPLALALALALLLALLLALTQALALTLTLTLTLTRWRSCSQASRRAHAASRRAQAA